MATKKITLNELRNIVRQVIKEETNNDNREKVINLGKEMFNLIMGYEKEKQQDKKTKIHLRTIEIKEEIERLGYILKVDRQGDSSYYKFKKNDDSEDFELMFQKRPMHGKTGGILKYNYTFLL